MRTYRLTPALLTLLACGAPQRVDPAPSPASHEPAPAPPAATTEAPAPAAAPAPRRVHAFRVEPRDATVVLEAPTALEPRVRVDVTSSVSGVIEQWNADVAQIVRRGDVLARLQPGGARGGRAGTVRAPIDGVVIARNVDLGAPVEAGRTVLLVLADVSSMRAVVQLPEADAQRVAVGQPAEVVFGTMPDRVFAGALTLVSPAITTAHTLPVELTLSNPDGSLRVGMSGTARIRVAHRPNVLAVPPTAVVTRGNRTYVFVVQGDDAREREVRAGAPLDIGVEIEAGLAEGETVVWPAADLADHDRVQTE